MEKAEEALIRNIRGLFFFSGAAALIYQIAWQRLLFAAFGIDLESVTLIVAVFMLGLGLGALAGGWLADRFPSHGLLLFALAEAGVGLYGLISSDLLTYAGDVLVHTSRGLIAFANFGLLLLPTLLMGATLPILVTHLGRIRPNIGYATGLMYASNTLGASVGALGAGFVLFHWLDRDQALQLAASLNILVALGVVHLMRKPAWST